MNICNLYVITKLHIIYMLLQITYIMYICVIFLFNFPIIYISVCVLCVCVYNWKAKIN